MKNRPSYIRLFNNGDLKDRIARLKQKTESCVLCPHACLVNRKLSKNGKCKSGYDPMISGYGPHFGEEPPLVGWLGSGTIFFSRCNLQCIFCQNYDISQSDAGYPASPEKLASIMMELQISGCHNINLVTPTHVIHAIAEALPLAIEMGLNLPLVYNSGGYDDVETLRLLDGIIDIYMPDFKYFSSEKSEQFSGIPDYPEIAAKAIKEMYRQVGDLHFSEDGIACRGLMIRHLVMPGLISETKAIIDFIHHLSEKMYFNLMDQYRPSYRALQHQEINRKITREEWTEALQYARNKKIKLAR